MFTDFWRPTKIEYIRRNSLYKFLSNFYDLILSDKPDFLIYSSFGYEYLKYDCIRIFFAGENVRPNFNECDFAFSFDYPITERNYRLPLYRLYPAYEKMLTPREPERVITENREFCCFLATNPEGEERNNFFHLLSSYKKVDAGGKVFFNLDQKVPRGKEIEWMSRYKFCIAFENSSYPGYTTEKLMNALAANTIPIYWGNPVVCKDFNIKAFINCHDYKNMDEVLEIVHEVDKNLSKYKSILSEPFLPENKERDFCKEELILNRFDEIFLTHNSFLPLSKKRVQRLVYPYKTLRKKILKIELL